MAALGPAEGGMRIGDYELVRRIGRGGMAEVWVAKKLSRARQQRYVAIKLMAEGLAGQERYGRMFRAEADLAAMLTHANIVQVFDEGVEEGRNYLVMEWVDGINLVKLGAVLSLCDVDLRDRIAAYVIGQLLHALAYAHSITTHDGLSLGVVHRDVSPQNVLISNHGDVKLTDFGVAHFVLDESSGMHVKGKVRYMSPEQLSGKTRSPTLDLYAAGAILHELVDGQKFRGDADQQVMYRDILAGRTPPLSRAIAPELDAVRRGLLEPDPSRRIQTAEQAIELLRLWSGYGEMKLELSRLCATMTGVTRPRTGPGASTPVPRAHDSTPRLPAAQASSAAQSGASRATPAYGDATPTVALAQGDGVPVQRPRGDTVLLPGSGLPFGVAVETEDALREATTATSLSPSGTAPNLRPAIDEPIDAPPRGRWVLAIVFALASIFVGGGVAWIVVVGFGSSKEKIAEPEQVGDAELAATAPAGDEAASGLVIGSAVAADSATAEQKADVDAAADAAPEDGARVDSPADAAAEHAATEDAAAEDAAENGAAADDPAGDEGPAAEDAAPRAKRPAPAKPRNPGSDATVAVHVRLNGIDRAELRIGKRTITAAPFFDGRLPVGRHKVKWRARASDSWHAAGSFNFVDGSEYVVRVSTNGPRLETR